ncbi:MFS transporter [Subtercola boreus]|uniref:MFS transporter n=1 Tax=Subtercola boreus TaxID=120213 RepID=A0A3E0VMA5_9MICO|nr:MFS transporter [Subtercola boreus]RFA10563.1 MFS transporter [Subtercola boreus]TQL55894.1 putative MFS family arabinose efflux permease [Subtercola boreus]
MSTHTGSVRLPVSAPARTGRRAWLAVLSVALGSFVLVLSEFLPIGLLPAIAADLDVSIGTAGLVVVATGLAAAVSAPVVTIVTSSLDRRVVLIALSAALVVADVAGALAPNFTVLLAARLLLGVALGGFWAIGAAVASRLVQPGSVIRATSFITAGISVATVVSLPLGALISSLASWRLAFLIGAGLALVALLGQLLLLPGIPSIQRVRTSTLVALLKVPRARIGLIGAAFVFFAQFAAYTFVSPYLEELVRLDPASITLALLVFGVAGVAGNFIAGFALDRSITATVVGAMAIAAVAILLLPIVAGSAVGAFVLLALWGMVWGGLPLAMQTWVISAAPAAAEGGLALFVTTIQISIAAGSTAGAVAVSTGGIAVDFWLAGGIAAVGAVTVLVLGVRRASAASASDAGEPITVKPNPCEALPGSSTLQPC